MLSARSFSSHRIAGEQKVKDILDVGVVVAVVVVVVVVVAVIVKKREVIIQKSTRGRRSRCNFISRMARKTRGKVRRDAATAAARHRGDRETEDGEKREDSGCVRVYARARLCVP